MADEARGAHVPDDAKSKFDDRALGPHRLGGYVAPHRPPEIIPPFRLLELLIEQREHVASKEEILRAIWPDAVVSDGALTRAISQIRKCLADDPRTPRYVVAVPKVGYRFIADVQVHTRSVPEGSTASDLADLRRPFSSA